MIDIGVNLSTKLLKPAANESFEEALERFVAQCRHHGLDGLIAIGTDLDSSRLAVSAARRFRGFIHATVGIHPHDARFMDEHTAAELQALLEDETVVAAGEMGLDFNRNFSPPADQEKAFIRQLEMNRDRRKPLYLHERDALERQLAILTEYESCYDKAVAHCFTGDRATLRHYLDLGFYIGITGWVCDERRGQDLAEAVSYIPRDRLLAETDSPYLLPRTLRPKPRSGRNQPWHVAEVIRFIASLLNITPEEVAELTSDNARQLFGPALSIPGKG